MGTLQKVALGVGAILGLGIIAKRFEGGVGLGELGTGISKVGTGILDVGIAPFKAVGLGLGEVGTGLTEFMNPLRDLLNMLTMGQMFEGESYGGRNGTSPTRPEDRNGAVNVGWSDARIAANWAKVQPSRPEDRARYF